MCDRKVASASAVKVTRCGAASAVELTPCAGECKLQVHGRILGWQEVAEDRMHQFQDMDTCELCSMWPAVDCKAMCVDASLANSFSV